MQPNGRPESVNISLSGAAVLFKLFAQRWPTLDVETLLSPD